MAAAGHRARRQAGGHAGFTGWDEACPSLRPSACLCWGCLYQKGLFQDNPAEPFGRVPERDTPEFLRFDLVEAPLRKLGPHGVCH